MKATTSIRWPIHWKIGCVVAVGVIALTIFALNIYDFLAVPTQRVDANILVVEGWIWDYAIKDAAQEFKQGGYTLIATSGLQASESGQEPVISSAGVAAKQLETCGIPAVQIISCPAEKTIWNRTASSARAVREKLRKEGITPKGINVLTVGPHARQTWLAYRRIFGPNIQVGIITVPRQGVDTAHWWNSAHGRAMVLKDFAGWLKESLFGYRS